MKHEPIRRPKRGEDSLTSDFALIGQAIVDAFRGMSSSSRLESRWSKLRNGSYC
jgi:hypothetical protein